ncbi:Protein Dicer, partial [Dictyocoela roeselum]
ERVTCSGVNFTFLKKQKFSDEHMTIIFFFQVIFFGINYKKSSDEDGTPYCYLALPIKNSDIDWTFLKHIYKNFILSEVRFADKQMLRENILFNPYSRVFYSYIGPSTVSLDETFRWGNRNVSTYRNYFENKYSVELESSAEPLFNGTIYSPKVNDKTISAASNILSTEIIHLTSFKKNYAQHFLNFKRYLNLFDNISAAYEFREKMGLKIPLIDFTKCFTSRIHSDDNYERTEFLGDAVLKYIVSKHLFFRAPTVGCLVASKSCIISNENLCKVAETIGIPRYFTHLPSCDSLFQPPSLFELIQQYADKDKNGLTQEPMGDKLQKCVEYFKYTRTFKSKTRSEYFKTLVTSNQTLVTSNQALVTSNKTSVTSKNINYSDARVYTKIYADILESIMGTLYIHEDLRAVEKLTLQLKIVSDSDIKCDCDVCKSLLNSHLSAQHEPEIDPAL